MKRIIGTLICLAIIMTCIPASAFAAQSATELVLMPWYFVESVDDDGVTLHLSERGEGDDKLTIEGGHALVIAEKITKGGNITYKAVSGAVSTSRSLILNETVRSENLEGGTYKLPEYLLEIKELGTYTIEYHGMEAELEVILPVLGYYSKPEISLKNWLGDCFAYDKSKENVFYIMIPEDYAEYIEQFEAGNEVTEKACTYELLDGYQHSYKVTVHEPVKNLYFLFYASNRDGKGDSITVVEKPDRVVLLSPATSSKHTVTVKWKKERCDGYQVQIATNSKFTKGVKTYYVKDDDTLKKTVKKLKKGKKYYMRVRAYEYYERYVYGRWSKYKAITCK